MRFLHRHKLFDSHGWLAGKPAAFHVTDAPPAPGKHPLPSAETRFVAT